MSYARFGNDSDVYVIGSKLSNESDGWVCYCWSTGVGFAEFGRLIHLQTHLEWHVSQGQKVPQRCLDRVAKELAALPSET